MGLKDIVFNRAYSSETGNILEDFYIPALKQSIEYHRLAGFFSSTSLAIAARGILGLIKNGGRMKIITSPRLSKKDIFTINSSSENPQKYYENILLSDLKLWEDKFINDHIYALGWMIANNRLEIKVAVVRNINGEILSTNQVIEQGIFHQKVGILYDDNGDILSFSGSINETASAWMNNIEEFKTFNSWNEELKKYVDADIYKFEKFWMGISDNIEIFDVPTAVKDRLIKIAPHDIHSISFATAPHKYPDRKINLYPHQSEAINAWLENKGRGIFEMATGTGKTFTALGCIDNLIKHNTHLITIIACPSLHLVKQWEREIKKFELQYDKIVIADSTSRNWKDHLADILIDVKIGYVKFLIVLTTHATFSSSDFRKILLTRKGSNEVLIVGDEVHGLGANKAQLGLVDDYKFRLGLSATPRRWFDSSGTISISSYFGQTVYEFSLRDAINKINPATGRTYLTPYLYLPEFVTLNEEELVDYQKLTKSILYNFNNSNETKNQNDLIELLIFKRANIVKNAEEKFIVLKKLLNEIDPVELTIIYCSPQQIERVLEILNNLRISCHRFTMMEGTKPEEKYGGISERDFLLKKFSEKEYKVLVAMECLDEGVDIPPARTAIFMASSGNPRQYIQRIGRVIRRYKGKTQAIVHDIIVAPNLEKFSDELFDIEWKVFDKEIERYNYIANIAINNIDSINKLFQLKNDILRGLHE